ncbi:dienelactone hydrolase family protein [Pigmentiphaga aceris]|uniref:Dienelactone hydrolase family protein n=1 Tax=Pigmentiphaga aceris TaxID=1940612 RepID=A0A5C0AXK7_9BURK|nr:dienelactone hydrolase family protein [Pigmentiphaga aceris]QEI07098.1 dienelactone hydrolase family protein [Pigmentiphaga aceris]
MPTEHTTISTPDGNCPAHVLTPEGSGPWPAIIFYADAGGIRPAMVDMARQLANAGYVVLLPDPYYRFGAYGPLVPKDVFAGDVGAILGPLMATTGNDKAAADTGAFLAWLDTRNDVASGKFGAVGFCMGGGMAIASAASWPDRFGAVASFHGGNLASDAPASPHRLVPKLAAEVYLAVAENDPHYPPDMAVRFEAALTAANVPYQTEQYAAAHGWMVPDFPVHNGSEARRGWQAMLAWFDRTLRTTASAPAAV